MSSTASPTRLGIAAMATSIAVLATACGSEPDEIADDAADSADDSEAGPSLSDPGILGVKCADGGLTASLLSDENGEEITSSTYSTGGLTGEEVPGFPAGRAIDSGRVSFHACSDAGLFTSARQAGQFLIPEHDAVLVTVREEVGGTEVGTIGVLDSEGNVSVLTEEQDVGDFDEPITFDTPRYDAAQDRVLYLEPDPESPDRDNPAGVVHEVDLSSGETAEAYECTVGCQTLWADQNTGLLSRMTELANNVPGLLLSPDGSIAVHRDSTMFWSVDSPTEVTIVNTERDEETPAGDTLDVHDSYFAGPVGDIVAFISDTELLLENNELSVVEVGESEIGPLDGDEDMPAEPLPVSYSLVPESPRDNGTPVVSPDLDEVMFQSTTDAGDTSWYRVPTDGSADPTEVAPVPEEAEGFYLVSWT